MPSTHKNRVQMTVSGTPGTGTITLGSAASGYQSFSSAHGANATVDCLFEDGTAWEIARGCTYTHSGTTLSRGTLEASSTGSAISLTSAAVVSQIAPADLFQRLERVMQAVMPGGRLTLTTGVPVTTSDVTGATTIYYTPYVHDTIPLWDGARWVPTTFTETSEALGTLTSGLPYDVFGFLSSGVLDLEKLAWTNGTTRATAVTLQDGRYCKSGDKTRLYLGTFYTTSKTTTEDSAGGTTTQVGGKRYLWNMYNQVLRGMSVFDSSAGWAYNSATIRQANATAGNKCEAVIGLASAARASVHSTTFSKNATSNVAFVGVGINSTTTNAARTNGVALFNSNPDVFFPLSAYWSGILAAGHNALNWVESGIASGSNTFQSGPDASNYSGLMVEVWA